MRDGSRRSHERLAPHSELAVAKVNVKPLPVIIQVSNPAAFSGQGSIIVVELPDEEAARRLARKLAQETGRQVTVRDAEMDIIEILAAPASH